MDKWEYLTQPMQTTDLAALGQDGWRLVSVDAGIMFFERMVEPPTKAEAAAAAKAEAAKA